MRIINKCIVHLKKFNMRFLILLMLIIICESALLIGCDQGMEQSIMQVVIPSESSIEKAKAAMEKVNERRTEVHQTAEKTGDFSNIFIASEDIFREELGFRKGFWVDLVEIYHQENLENATLLEGFENLQDAFAERLTEGTLGMFYFEYIRYFDEIIIEYLRLSFDFPEKSEKELLALFRESVNNRKISIVFP